MDLSIRCETVDIDTWNNELNVDMENINESDIIEFVREVVGNMDPHEIITVLNEYSINSILDEIGIEKCKNYFDLEEIDG